jgi:excisionase family DNA binding protein
MSEPYSTVIAGKFYTIDDIADLLGVSTRTVRRAIERGELIAHKLGRAVRIAEADLKAFIAQHRCL